MLETDLIIGAGLGMMGPMEWGILLVVVLIFFGAGKLPQVFGQLGKGVKSFKDGMNEKDADLISENTSVSETTSERVTDAQEV